MRYVCEWSCFDTEFIARGIVPDEALLANYLHTMNEIGNVLIRCYRLADDEPLPSGSNVYIWAEDARQNSLSA